LNKIKKKRNQLELEEQNFVENITETNDTSDIDTRSLSYISDISSYHSETESDTEFKADTYSIATATDNSVNQEDETEQYHENQYSHQQVIEIKEENYEMKNYRKKAESENELTEDYQTESYEIRKKKKHKKKSKKKSKTHNLSDAEEEVNV